MERIPHQHLSMVTFPGLGTMGKIKWVRSVTEAREMMRSFVSANILCGENKWAQKIWVQLQQKPPGHPAEPLNTMFHIVSTTTMCVYCPNELNMSVWLTQKWEKGKVENTNQSTQNSQQWQHNKQVQRLLISLISPNSCYPWQHSLCAASAVTMATDSQLKKQMNALFFLIGDGDQTFS